MQELFGIKSSSRRERQRFSLTRPDDRGTLVHPPAHRSTRSASCWRLRRRSGAGRTAK